MPYIGNQPAANFASVTKDTFDGGDTSGASSVSEYTLSKAATTNGVAVFVENVRQEPTTAYSVSGTTLTFTGTTPSGTNNVYVLHHNAPASTATHPAAQDLTAANATLTGNVTVGGTSNLTITDGNLVVGTSGHGIDFSATSDLAGKSSELLDDYEEGTYTVTLTTATSGTITLKDTHNTGTYIKIGRLVLASCDARIHSTSSPQGNLHIGLPFAVASDGGSYLSSMVTHGVTIQTSQQGDFFIKGNDGQSYGNVHYNTTTNLGLQAESGGLGANDEFQFNLTYLTT